MRLLENIKVNGWLIGHAAAAGDDAHGEGDRRAVASGHLQECQQTAAWLDANSSATNPNGVTRMKNAPYILWTDPDPGYIVLVRRGIKSMHVDM